MYLFVHATPVRKTGLPKKGAATTGFRLPGLPRIRAGVGEVTNKRKKQKYSATPIEQIEFLN
jgi:hypothetical protein